MPTRFLRGVSPLLPVLIALCLPAALAREGCAQTPYRLVDLSEAGGLFRFERARSGEVVVTVRHHEAWEVFDFELRGAVAGVRIAFRVENAPPGTRPRLRSAGSPWRPIPPSAEAPEPPGTERAAIRFTVDPPARRFTVRLIEPRPAPPAHDLIAPYYDYPRFQSYMAQIQGHPLAQVTTIGTSIQGRPLVRILIDDPAYPAAGKKSFVMVVRQHGNEHGSSYVLEGTLDLLLGRQGLDPAVDLRRRIRWIIYPLVNPDGAVANQRGNANGVDLNRDWLGTGSDPRTQEPETFAHQSDLEMLALRFPIHRGGDHHGWGRSRHGGFRYSQGRTPTNLTVPEYEEARKDTEVIALHDPTQIDWSENGGTPGMFRAEMFLMLGALFHTPEYTSSLSTEAEFYLKGQQYARAVLDFLQAPVITSAAGAPRCALRVQGDGLYATVDDLDENLNSFAAEAVRIQIGDRATADAEILWLTETGPDTAIFRNALPLPITTDSGSPVPGDGILESRAGSRVVATYADDDYPPDTSTAEAEVFSLGAAPALEFAIEPEAVSAGQAAVLRTCQGLPSAPLALILSSVNGQAILFPLRIESLGLRGMREWPLVVPPDPFLAGNTLGFQTITLDQMGLPLVSNMDVVSLR